MKAVILALLVLVVVSHGEALKCRCKGNSCEQTCHGSNQVCASIVIPAGSQVTSIQGCMDANDCRMMGSQASYHVCCNWDLCNR